MTLEWNREQERAAKASQDVWAAYRQTILSVNGIRTLIVLLKMVSKEPQLRGPLSSLQKQGKLLVPGLNARLEPAQDCVHAFTAPRTLLQRSSPRLPANPPSLGSDAPSMQCIFASTMALHSSFDSVKDACPWFLE